MKDRAIKFAKLVRHLGEMDSDFGSLTGDLVYQDALIKYIFPEYDLRYWRDEETNDDFESAVSAAIEELKGEFLT